jgi:hypothetical protein
MRLTKKAIAQLKQNKMAIAHLCTAMGKGISTVELWLANNKVDGPLTTATAIAVVEKYVSVEILEKPKVKA